MLMAIYRLDDSKPYSELLGVFNVGGLVESYRDSSEIRLVVLTNTTIDLDTAAYSVVIEKPEGLDWMYVFFPAALVSREEYGYMIKTESYSPIFCNDADALNAMAIQVLSHRRIDISSKTLIIEAGFWRGE